MKRVMIKDILFGVLIVIVITILEFIVTIPIGEPAEQIDKEAWENIINCFACFFYNIIFHMEA